MPSVLSNIEKQDIVGAHAHPFFICFALLGDKLSPNGAIPLILGPRAHLHDKTPFFRVKGTLQN